MTRKRRHAWTALSTRAARTPKGNRRTLETAIHIGLDRIDWAAMPVAAGELVMAAGRKTGFYLLRIGSEHSAVHQCRRGWTRGEVRRLGLTASGGPFRKTRLAMLTNVTTEQAVAHPNWRMGNRIT